MVFCNLRREISPLRVSKKYLRLYRKSNGSNGTPLYPPLFWLDNIFKEWDSDSDLVCMFVFNGLLNTILT